MRFLTSCELAGFPRFTPGLYSGERTAVCEDVHITWGPPSPAVLASCSRRFGNEWVKGPSRAPGSSFEWDVQLSRSGRNQLGRLSRDNAHRNISLDGRVTHR
jgi:hypothetical protein